MVQDRSIFCLKSAPLTQKRYICARNFLHGIFLKRQKSFLCRALVSLFLTALVIFAYADIIKVFDPQMFVRGEGEPVAVTERFTAPKPNARHAHRVTNCAEQKESDKRTWDNQERREVWSEGKDDEDSDKAKNRDGRGREGDRDDQETVSGTPTVSVSSTTYATLGGPFEAVVSCSGTVFVSVTDNGTPGSKTGVQVFTPTDGSLQSTCVNELPSWLLSEGAAPANLDFLPHRIDIAGGIGDPGAIFYNVAALQSCAATGFVVSQGPIASVQGTLAVKVTPDEKYAFVSNEYGVANGATTGGNIGVVQLQLDANGDVTTGTTLIGQISTGGNAIAGMTLSPDGTRLYVTSEVADRSTSASGGSNPVLARTGCGQNAGGKGTINGLLTVIDVATAETTPGPAAVLATIDAGCSPVRMAESRDESTLWVAVRGDDRVLAFSPMLLESNPDNALLGYASTGGTAPVGVALFHDDQLLAVANSNRFNTGTANAAILYVAAPATATVVQIIATGRFPREITVGPDDATLYLTNYNSDTFQVIETTVY